MRFRLVAAFALIAVAVAGCTSSTSGEPTTQPRPTPTTSSPTTPPQSSTPTTPAPTVPTTGPNVRPGEKPPVLPRLAMSNSAAGAVAFASYWFSALDWGYATTSPALLREYSSSSCSECARFAGIISMAADLQEHFRGGHINTTAFKITDAQGHDSASRAVDVTYTQQPVMLLTSSNHLVRRASGLTRVVRRLWLSWRDGRWVVVDTKQVVTQ